MRLPFVAILFFIATSSVAQESAVPCSTELVAAAADKIPEVFQYETGGAAEAWSTWLNCRIRIPEVIPVLDAANAQIGTLRGVLTNAESVSGQVAGAPYWIFARNDSSSFFAVKDSYIDLLVQGGLPYAVSLDATPDLWARYNPEFGGDEPIILGPIVETLEPAIADWLTLKYTTAGLGTSDIYNVHLVSEPSGADVWLGEVHKGVTETNLALRRHLLAEIRFTLKGYQECRYEDAEISGDPKIQIVLCTLLPQP